MIKNKALAGITVVAALLLAACSQGTSDTATGADEGTVAEATGTKPAPFDAGPVKIAIVQNSGAGDYFQQWTNGANKQAEAIGFEVQVYDAQADNAKQATDMETAIGSGVAGIIVDHGQADTMCPLINKALEQESLLLCTTLQPLNVHQMLLQHNKAMHHLHKQC